MRFSPVWRVCMHHVNRFGGHTLDLRGKDEALQPDFRSLDESFAVVYMIPGRPSLWV